MRARMKLICLVTIAALACPSSAPAYSVLTHEGIIDASWDASIKPLLRARFPKLSDADLDEARAYSYGGAVIHDLGYYPFGSKLFSNLLHYVRSGDFVEALITDAADVNEYAFALGALAHYAADNNGHPIGVNRVVPIMYPKERARHGDEVTYVEAPKQHLLVEFSFDVVQVAAGAYAPEAFHRFIGFKVAEPLLDRAFLETYGIEMGPLFLDRSLAIGTFRYAVGQAIPQMTKAAWKNKRKEIEKLTPGVTQRSFVFNLPRREYEKEFGHDYAKPTGFARIVSILYHLVPKIGPFRALAFKVPTPEAEKLFLESFARTKERYAQELAELRAGKPALSNTNFDTGQPLTRGRYSLEDEAYDDLIKKLGDRKSGTITPALRSDLIRHFGNTDPRVSKLR